MQQSLNNSTALGPLTGWWNCLEYDKWCCIVVYWTWYTLLALMLIIKHSTAQSKASLGHFSPKVVLISSYIYIKGIIIRLLYLFLAVSLTSMKYLKKLNVFFCVVWINELSGELRFYYIYHLSLTQRLV